jgi:uncharacterized protein (DUF1015 family)
MAHIKAFRAWRYNESKIPDPASAFAPLYEVVGKKQRQKLYNIPYNAIHLSMPRSHPDAAASLRDWKREGYITQDQSLSFFAYFQQFTLFGVAKPFVRKGILCLLHLEESDIVLHEGVIPQAVSERARLLSSIGMQVVPTHGLYQDDKYELEPMLDRYMRHPVYSFLDQQGVVNSLSPVTAKEDIQRIRNLLEDKSIYLADGHHRLASSRAYLKQQRRTRTVSTDDPALFHFMYLTNMAGDDLRILPTHRIWKPEIRPDVPSLRSEMAYWFDIHDVSRSRKALFDLIKGKQGAFGMASQGRRFIMELKAEFDPNDLIDLNLAEAVKKLDYTLLHYLIFDQLLGLPYEEQRSSSEIEYEKDYSKVIASVNKGEAALSFVVQEVSIPDFLAVCHSGAKMPPKSTYFYPKVNCGMVMTEL